MDESVAPIPAAETLCRAREFAGISRSELARRSGVAVSTIWNYETGRMDPSFSRMLDLLSHCNVTLGFIQTEAAHRGDALVSVLELADVMPHKTESEQLPSWNELLAGARG